MKKECTESEVINIINNISYTDNIITFIVNHKTIDKYKSVINKLNGHYSNNLDYTTIHRDISINNILTEEETNNIIITSYHQQTDDIKKFISIPTEYNIILPVLKYNYVPDITKYHIAGGTMIMYKSTIIIDIDDSDKFIITKNRYS